MDKAPELYQTRVKLALLSEIGQDGKIKPAVEIEQAY